MWPLLNLDDPSHSKKKMNGIKVSPKNLLRPCNSVSLALTQSRCSVHQFCGSWRDKSVEEKKMRRYLSQSDDCSRNVLAFKRMAEIIALPWCLRNSAWHWMFLLSIIFVSYFRSASDFLVHLSLSHLSSQIDCQKPNTVHGIKNGVVDTRNWFPT